MYGICNICFVIVVLYQCILSVTIAVALNKWTYLIGTKNDGLTIMTGILCRQSADSTFQRWLVRWPTPRNDTSSPESQFSYHATVNLN